MRRLWGDGFTEKIAQFKGFIVSEMNKKNCNEVIAAMNIIRDLQRDMPDSGMSQLAILAACVECIEPSVVVQTVPLPNLRDLL